jgi:hypothetical protein
MGNTEDGGGHVKMKCTLDILELSSTQYREYEIQGEVQDWNMNLGVFSR